MNYLVWEQEVSRGSFSDGMLYIMSLERGKNKDE